MMGYKVSVIVPAYNSERYISRCVDSLLNQTLGKELQVIVVNDGSTDSTLEICKKYEDANENFVVITKLNAGQAFARNTGLEYAKGEFVGFVDSDDYVDLNMYKSLYETAASEHADLIYSYMTGESYFENPIFDTYENGIIAKSRTQIDFFKSSILGPMPNESDDSCLGMSVCRSIFRKKIIDNNDLVFKSERIVNSEDLLFNVDFLNLATKVCTFNKCFYMYCHDNPASFSVKANPNRFNMFVNLYNEMLERSSCEDDLLRIKRRFIANVRVAIVEKVRWKNYSGYHKARKEITQIIRNENVVQALTAYPLYALSLGQRLFYLFVKMNSPLMLMILIEIRYGFWRMK